MQSIKKNLRPQREKAVSKVATIIIKQKILKFH